nr:HNH endonuclease signature motif containing protein [uncultured Rhodopila sp.]
MSETFVTEDGETVTYHEYLQTETWQRKRQGAYLAYEGRCGMCGRLLRFEGKWAAHHKHYRNIGSEPLDDLVLLCYRCHKAYHKGLKLLEGNRSKVKHQGREDAKAVRRGKTRRLDSYRRAQKLDRIARGMVQVDSTGPFQSPPSTPRCRRESVAE